MPPSEAALRRRRRQRRRVAAFTFAEAFGSGGGSGGNGSSVGVQNLIPVRACLVGPVWAAAAADQVLTAMDVPMGHLWSTGPVLTAMDVPMGHRATGAAAWALRAL